MNQHKERKHAELGGSSADRWSNCTGSYSLLKTCPPKVVGEAALLGTRAHECLEILLKGFLNHKIHGTPIPVVKEEDSVLEVVHETVNVIWEKVFLESVTDKSWGIETKFTIEISLDMYGYIDLWLVYIDDKGKKCGVIFDFKHGFHAVPVENNPQLAFYSVAMQESFLRKNKSLDYIRAIIYQPRVYGEESYKETKFTAKQLDTWKKRFLKAGNDIMVEKKQSFKAGTWCKWCDAQSICKTYKNELSKISSLKLLETEHELFPEIPDPMKLSDEEISKIVLHGEKVKKFIDACKSYAIDRNLNGKPVLGTKCVHSKSRRQWKSDEEYIGEYLTSASLVQSEIYSKKLKGITLIEDSLTKVYGRKEAKNILDEVTVMSVPSIQLVSEEDPRAIISSNGQTLLKNIET